MTKYNDPRWEARGTGYNAHERHWPYSRKFTTKQIGESLFEVALKSYRKLEFSDAKFELKDCLEKDPKHKIAKKLLKSAAFWEKSGKIANATLKRIIGSREEQSFSSSEDKKIGEEIAQKFPGAGKAAVEFGMGRAYLAMGNSMDWDIFASERMRAAISALGSSVDTLLERGMVHLLLSELRETDANIARARKLNPYLFKQ